jgi:hypothetical protein
MRGSHLKRRRHNDKWVACAAPDRHHLQATDGCADQFTLCVSTIRAETTANSASVDLQT